MITIKTPAEISLMRESGRIAGNILKKTCEQAKVGISTLELNNFAEDLIKKAGVTASFKTVEHYAFACCINVNDGIVHGLPSSSAILKPGDLVKIDLGVIYQGWHSDTASSVYLPSGDAKKDLLVKRFLDVGKETLAQAIAACRPGNHVSDVSRVIETEIEVKNDYSVVYELTGHGLGRELHEDPDIPGVLMAGPDATFKEGMTVAIEVIYALGDGAATVTKDGWTIKTKDGSLAGLFEHSVAITASGPRMLTEST